MTNCHRAVTHVWVVTFEKGVKVTRCEHDTSEKLIASLSCLALTMFKERNAKFEEKVSLSKEI